MIPTGLIGFGAMYMDNTWVTTEGYFHSEKNCIKWLKRNGYYPEHLMIVHIDIDDQIKHKFLDAKWKNVLNGTYKEEDKYNSI